MNAESGRYAAARLVHYAGSGLTPHDHQALGINDAIATQIVRRGTIRIGDHEIQRSRDRSTRLIADNARCAGGVAQEKISARIDRSPSHGECRIRGSITANKYVASRTSGVGYVDVRVT